MFDSAFSSFFFGLTSVIGIFTLIVICVFFIMHAIHKDNENIQTSVSHVGEIEVYRTSCHGCTKDCPLHKEHLDVSNHTVDS